MDAVNGTGAAHGWIMRSAVDYLSKRSTSRAHLAEVLRRKARRRLGDDAADAEAAIEAAVERCATLGFVHDGAYVEQQVAAASRQGVSTRRLRAQLRSKGIEPEAASAAMEEGLDETASALRFARKRRLGPWSREEEPDRLRERAKMGRAGFDDDVARRVLSMEVEEAEARLGGAPDD